MPRYERPEENAETARIRRWIAALRLKTVANGCSRDEAASAQVVADELEMSLRRPAGTRREERDWTPPRERSGAERWDEISRRERAEKARKEAERAEKVQRAAKTGRRSTVRAQGRAMPKIWNVFETHPPDGMEYLEKVGKTEYQGRLLHRVRVHGGKWDGQEVLVSSRLLVYVR